jgi:osmotically-inducible protein OsmY
MPNKLRSKISTALVVLAAVSLTIVVAQAAAGDRQRAQRSDSAIKSDLRRILRADRFLDDSSIVVESVRHGVVLLGGSAASPNDVVRALRAVSRRPGVRRVFSEIVDAPPFREGLVGVVITDAPAAPRVAIDAGDDAIRRGVITALLDLDARGNADIRVLVTDGVVHLGGTVPSWQGNSSRLHATRSVTGVRSIFNEMRAVTVNAGSL